MARFVNAQVPEVVQPFWAALQRGEFITDAAAAAGTYRKQGSRWVRACGGVRPRRGRNLKGRCLSFAEREEIALGARRAASRCARSPPAGPRRRRRSRASCAATPTRAAATGRRPRTRWPTSARRRPKPAKLATNLALRAMVEQDLQRRYSPEQIAGRLRREFPDDPEMWVSTETIYQSLYVQSRGALRRELTRCLRTGRALRQPGRQAGQRKNRIPNMINICRAPGRGRRPRGARPLGGRPDHRQAQPDRDRHAGRAHHAATRCSCTCPTATSPSRSRRRSPRKIQTLPEHAAPRR